MNEFRKGDAPRVGLKGIFPSCKLLENLAATPRCKAWARQAGRRCRQPVVPGRNVCRHHGGYAGAPKGTPGRVTHGHQTAATEAAERAKRARARQAKALVEATVQQAESLVKRSKRKRAK